MTRDEVLARLVTERAVFEAKLAKVPADRVDTVPPGRAHSPKEVVAHLTAYEELIVERLRAAREGKTTAFDRDRVGWEQFNERVWDEARAASVDDVMRRAREVFGDLVVEVRNLTDDELNGVVGITESIDPAWLDGRTLAELIAIDGYDHYAMHHEAMEAASRL